MLASSKKEGGGSEMESCATGGSNESTTAAKQMSVDTSGEGASNSMLKINTDVATAAAVGFSRSNSSSSSSSVQQTVAGGGHNVVDLLIDKEKQKRDEIIKLSSLLLNSPPDAAQQSFSFLQNLLFNSNGDGNNVNGSNNQTAAALNLNAILQLQQFQQQQNQQQANNQLLSSIMALLNNNNNNPVVASGASSNQSTLNDTEMLVDENNNSSAKKIRSDEATSNKQAGSHHKSHHHHHHHHRKSSMKKLNDSAASSDKKNATAAASGAANQLNMSSESHHDSVLSSSLSSSPDDQISSSASSSSSTSPSNSSLSSPGPASPSIMMQQQQQPSHNLFIPPQHRHQPSQLNHKNSPSSHLNPTTTTTTTTVKAKEPTSQLSISVPKLPSTFPSVSSLSSSSSYITSEPNTPSSHNKSNANHNHTFYHHQQQQHHQQQHSQLVPQRSSSPKHHQIMFGANNNNNKSKLNTTSAGFFFGSNPTLGSTQSLQNINQSKSGLKSNNGLSDEVRQKLKSVILQKLENNKSSSTASSGLRHNASSSNHSIAKSSSNSKLATSGSNAALSSSRLNQPHNHQSNGPVRVGAANNFQINPNQNNMAMSQEEAERLLLMMRRTTSEPNLKVKSALKDRLMERRNKYPFAKPSLPPQQHQQHNLIQQAVPSHLSAAHLHSRLFNHNQHNLPGFVSSPTGAPPSLPQSASLSNLNSNQSSNQILAAATMAAAAALAAFSNRQQQQQQQQQQHQSNDNQMASAIAAVTAASLSNPSLAPLIQQLQQQLLIPAAHAPSAHPHPSSFSVPSLAGHYNRPQVTNNFYNQHHYNPTKFGHMADVEEENEALLALELKNAAKLNETAVSKMNSGAQGDRYMRDIDEERMENDEEDEDINLMDDDYDDNQIDHRAQMNESRRHGGGGGSHADHGHMRHNSEKSGQELMKELHHQEGSSNHLHHQQSHQQQSQPAPSFFSDPYLLRSFQIASISSSSNLISSPGTTNVFSEAKSSRFQPIKSSNSGAASLATKKQLNQFLTRNLANQVSKKPTASAASAALDFNTSSQLESSETKSYRYTTGIVYDELMLKHECTCGNPSQHLETPERLRCIWDRVVRGKSLDDECEIVESRMCSVNDLLTCHSEQYALIFGSDLEQRARLPKEYLQSYVMSVCLAPCRGFALTYDEDNSWNEEHTPVACRVAVGSTYQLAKLVYESKLRNGFALVRPPGSHAEVNKPLGFCYFNNIAIVAKLLKKNLMLERILILDWDVHHGNGTQQMTYKDPGILYVSLHRHDNSNFFPGTGAIDECGQDAGLGKNVNIAWNSRLNPPMGDAEYLAAFRSIVMPIAQSYQPEMVLVSCGFDASDNHPRELGGYRVSPACFAYMTKKLTSLADGKVVLALEGGYDLDSLCHCSEMCLNALMNKPIAPFTNQTLEALPNVNAILDLENVVEIQKKYWPVVREYKQYIRMSHSQYINSVHQEHN